MQKSIRVEYDKKKIDRLIEGLEGAPQAIRDGLYEVIGSSLMQVHRIAVQPGYAPRKTGTLVRSLTWSIASGIGGGIVFGAVGSNLPYARIHEKGGDTGRNKKTHIIGKHYLERGVNESTPDIAKRFAKIQVLKKR